MGQRSLSTTWTDDLFEAAQPQPAAPCAPHAGAQPLERPPGMLCKELFPISTKSRGGTAHTASGCQCCVSC